MRYIRAFLLLCLFAFGTATFAQDYPQAEVYGGYSYLNAGTSPNRVNVNGWEASISGNVNKWFAAEGDFGGYYRNSLSDYFYGGGPRVNIRPVFLHALVGGDHSKGGNGLDVVLGGGVQWKVAPQVSFRTSVDYVYSHQNFFIFSSSQNNFRVGVGLVYSFGGAAKGAQSPATATTTASMPIPALGLRAGTRDNGAEVVAVEPGGVAALAGLHVTDVINKVDGKPISTAMELAAELSNHAPGSQVRLGYMFRSSALGYFQKETVVILGPLSK